MRTFATLALLAVAACAVDVNADAQLGKKQDKNTETDHTVKVNVWTTIDNELTELMDEVNALIASVAVQASSLSDAMTDFATLNSDTTDLRTQA